MTRSAAAPLFDMWCKSEDIPFFNSRAAAKIRYWPVNPLHFIRRIGGSAVGANPVQPSNKNVGIVSVPVPAQLRDFGLGTRGLEYLGRCLAKATSASSMNRRRGGGRFMSRRGTATSGRSGNGGKTQPSGTANPRPSLQKRRLHRSSAAWRAPSSARCGRPPSKKPIRSL